MTMKLFLLLLLLAGNVLAFGQEQKFVTVEARGIGATPDAATRDALSQAVQQAAGAIVDSQTLIKNDEIMQEKILTASNAIVKKYDVIVPVKKNRSGLFEIRIKAQVESNLLRQKLIEYKIIEGKVEGTQDIWAEIVTQEKNQVDMQTMIENVFSKVDFKRYLNFDLIGVNGTRGNEAKLHMEYDPKDKSKVFIAVGLVCMFDAQRFQNECMPHIRKIFDSLPFEEKKVFTNQTEPGKTLFMLPPVDKKTWNNLASVTQQEWIKNGRVKVVASYRVTPIYHWNELVLREKCNVQGRRKKIFLNVSPKYRPGSQRFVCYAHTNLELSKIVKKIEKELESYSVSLCLLDGDGNEVRRMTQKIVCTSDYYRNGSYAGFFADGGDVVISPEFFEPESRISSPLIIKTLQTTIPLEDFKDIKSFKLETNTEK